MTSALGYSGRSWGRSSRARAWPGGNPRFNPMGLQGKAMGSQTETDQMVGSECPKLAEEAFGHGSEILTDSWPQPTSCRVREQRVTPATWGEGKWKEMEASCWTSCSVTFKSVGLLLHRFPHHLPETVGDSEAEVSCSHLMGLQHAFPTKDTQVRC